MEPTQTETKPTIKHKLPKYVLDAAKILRTNGYEAYLVGGSVRDILLERNPQDYDIATNAYPEEVEKIFTKSIPTGAKFGTMLVLLPDETGENYEIEITTYRSEADYFGGRWPAKVEFTKTIQEDLARRDFTINAIALRLDDNDLNAEDIVDPYAGLADLEQKLIRAVGDPLERFSEDGLRPIRACRLAANLGFEIEPMTFAAITKTLDVTKQVSTERIRDELMKLLLKSAKPSVGLMLMKDSGLLELIIPELLEGVAVTQPQFHVDDVFTHTLKAVDLAEDNVKLATLFHDIGKPRTKSEDEKGVHFYGHDQVGAQMTEEIMQRLKFSNAEIERTANLVRHHMFYYPAADWRKQLAQPTTAETTTIIALRHGEVVSDKDIILGQMDRPLSDMGVTQAENIATELATKGIGLIVTSTLGRAEHTAKIIASKLSLEYILEPRFQERNFGELQGLTWEQFSEQYPNLAAYPGNSAKVQEYLPSGETIAAIEDRVRVGIYNLLKHHSGKTILLVTHTGVIRILKRLLAEMNAQESRESDPNYCEYTTFNVTPIQLTHNFLSDQELDNARFEQTESSFAGGWSDAAVRRFIRAVGGQENVDDLMRLRIADAGANPKSPFNPNELQVLAERIAAVREKDMALKVTDLAITGADLMQELKLAPGKEIGQILNYLLEEVTEEPLNNNREKLLELARTEYSG